MRTESKTSESIPIACNLSDAGQQVRREEVVQEIMAGVQAVRALEDGYELRFPGDDAWAQTLTEFILFERRCCPFFRFELISLPGQAGLWLRLRGDEGVKAFVETAFVETAFIETVPAGDEQ